MTIRSLRIKYSPVYHTYKPGAWRGGGESLGGLLSTPWPTGKSNSRTIAALLTPLVQHAINLDYMAGNIPACISALYILFPGTRAAPSTRWRPCEAARGGSGVEKNLQARSKADLILVSMREGDPSLIHCISKQSNPAKRSG